MPVPTPKHRVASVDPNETTEQKLKRLCEARMPKALARIDQLGNLATYKPTEEQAKKIVDTLYSAVERVEQRLFKSSGKPAGEGFKL